VIQNDAVWNRAADAALCVSELSSSGQLLRKAPVAVSLRSPQGSRSVEAPMARKFDDWTIDRWRTEPQWRALDLDEPQFVEQAPPLWKDLTLASVVAAALWVAAVILVR
jgi:hypothetical protein